MSVTTRGDVMRNWMKQLEDMGKQLEEWYYFFDESPYREIRLARGALMKELMKFKRLEELVEALFEAHRIVYGDVPPKKTDEEEAPGDR